MQTTTTEVEVVWTPLQYSDILHDNGTLNLAQLHFQTLTADFIKL